MVKLGIGVYGSRVLEVRGRKSGEWRQTPVNLLTVDAQDYLVAPRGHTQWVRNIRVSGGGRLRLGRRTQEIKVVELTDEQKPPLLRAYLKRWAWEVKAFFDGVDAELDRRAAAGDRARPSGLPAGARLTRRSAVTRVRARALGAEVALV